MGCPPALAPKPTGVVKTGDGRGPPQAEGEHPEAREDSQLTLAWDVAQNSPPFNRAQANKGWTPPESPAALAETPAQACFRAASPSTQVLEGLFSE